MNPPRTASTVAKAVLLLSFLCLALFSVNGLLTSTAQSNEERELEDKIPKHLPIKFKIKKEKEKAFKDLKNEKWLRDFELEVTNTGDKPIYFLAILLEMPQLISESGRKLGYPLVYGREELADFTAKVVSTDVPIEPGESYVFKMPVKWAKGMEVMRARLKKPDPERVRIRFQVINFGDGTGFVRTDGMAVPHTSDK